MTMDGGMTEICAFIVGIDHYDQPGWTVDGPCRNALAIAQWLRDIAGVPPDQIYLFLAMDNNKEARGESVDLRTSINRLHAEGVTVKECAKQATIRKFWREHLRDIPVGSKLFVYWSGHGTIAKDGQRAFAYSNYTSSDKTIALDADFFCRSLRSDEYSRFRDQLILADVCGAHSDDLSPAKEDELGTIAGIRQIRCFATPAGAYARVHGGFGQFTEALLETLRSSTGWPIDETDRGQRFRMAVEDEFKRRGGVPHWGVFDAGNQEEGWLFSRKEDALWQSCHAVLSCCSLSDDRLLGPYRQTANRLGVGVLPDAERLPDMLRALCQLHTPGVAAPYGLVDFLLRVTDVEGLAPAIAGAITAWLNDNADPQTVASVRHAIDVERKQKHLIVRVENRSDGKLSGYEASLRYGDDSIASSQAVLHTPVTTVKALERDLKAQITIWCEKGELHAGDHVHILAKPPLFHIPFHTLCAAPDGTELGGFFIVTIHDKERVTSSSHTLAALRKHDAALRKHDVAWHVWMEVKHEEPLSDEAALRIILFPPDATKNRAAKAPTVLARLLRLGIPYLCLSYNPTKITAPTGLTDALRDVEAPKLDDIPNAFYRARVRGVSVAVHSGLLWDNPNILPFTPA